MKRTGQFFYISEEAASEPVSGQAIVNEWWSVHPEKGLMFHFVPTRSDPPAPQCNRHQGIAEGLTRRSYPEHEVKQIPVVFMTHAIREARRIREELNTLAELEATTAPGL